MDKQPVGQLPDLASSNNDDEIMVITNDEYNQLKKEKISDFITDLTSTDENNAIVKGTDGKMFVTDFGNASNITEGTLPTSVLPEIPLEKIPDIPKDKLPQIETDDLPDSGITAGTYTYPTDIVVNSKGQVTSITEGQAGANNANQDLSNLSEAGEKHFANPDLSNLTAEGEKHFLNKNQITNCILSAPNGVATYSGSNITLKQGLKMLYPNGRNIDKTLKNGELTLDSDTILDLSSYSGLTFDFELMFGCNINNSHLSQNYQESDVVPTNIGGFNQIYLNTTENQMYFYYSSTSSWDKKTFIKLGKGRLENGVVTSFIPYQPVELIKRTDPQIQAPYITETYVNGTSWYRVWSDGWIEQGGKTTIPTASGTTINFLKSFSNTNYWCMANLSATDLTANYYEAGVVKGSKKTTSMIILSRNYGTVDIREYYWQAKGF